MKNVNYKDKATEILRNKIQKETDKKQEEYDKIFMDNAMLNLLNTYKEQFNRRGIDMNLFGYNELTQNSSKPENNQMTAIQLEIEIKNLEGLHKIFE